MHCRAPGQWRDQALCHYNGTMPPSAKSIRVYLLDDHDLVRRGLRDLLASVRDIHVVGDSRSALAAPEAIVALRTDVMVLDLHLQDGTGVQVCRRVRGAEPRIRGLLLTASSDDEAAMASILAGAAGYITKYAASADLINTLRRVGSGQDLMDEAVRDRMSAQLLSQVRAVRPEVPRDVLDLLSLVTEGLTDREIAERVGRDATEVAGDIAALVDVATSGQLNPLTQPPPGSRTGKHRASEH
jgi:DNA-binding NarL/FixJ family response regulator